MALFDTGYSAVLCCIVVEILAEFSSKGDEIRRKHASVCREYRVRSFPDLFMGNTDKVASRDSAFWPSVTSGETGSVPVQSLRRHDTDTDTHPTLTLPYPLPCHLRPDSTNAGPLWASERFAVLTTATKSCNEAGAERDLQVQGVFQQKGKEMYSGTMNIYKPVINRIFWRLQRPY